MLRTKNSELHKLLASSPEAMVIVDGKGKIVQFNKTLEKLFGYTAEELTGAGLDILVAERHRKNHAKHREHFFSTASIRPMSTGMDLYGCRKDGKEFPVEVSLHPFETEDGALVYAAIRDVSELKRTQDLLQTAIEAIPEGFAYFDADDRLAIFNKKMAQIYPLIGNVFQLGTTFEEVLRAGVEKEQYVEADRSKEEFFKERLAYHRDPKGVVEYVLPDGRWIRVEEKKMPDGGTVGIRTDITDLKNAEREIEAQRDELAKLNAQKDRFFSIIAHDLRSPFNALLGYSEALAMQANSMDQDKITEYASLVHRLAEQAFKLLEDLLDWSHLQLDRLEFKPEPLNIMTITDANLVRFEPVALAKKIQLKGNGATKATVYADARMVDTILRNLINNAIKFTPQHGVVNVSTVQAKRFVEINVTDTGVGMGQDKVANLFHMEQKTATLGTEGETGTGLGLYLCEILVKKQGGEIRVESIEGKGSCFRFTLPLHRE